MSGPCFIVPPHLLRGIAESEHNSEATRNGAKASLASYERVVKAYHERLTALAARPAAGNPRHARIIPEAILAHLSLTERAQEGTCPDPDKKDEADTRKVPRRSIFDAKHVEAETDLPGELVRSAGEGKGKDKAVNEAYDNVGHVLDFYKDEFHWKSIDNNDADVVSSVHFGQGYQNAFWDPEKLQMVFGDGGEYLGNFTGCIDVIGHEITHAVTEHTSPLNYEDQPGALNEHISDVFGIMIKQKLENDNVHEANWLIGEGCLMPDVKGVALRSMKSPGKAYDDPRLGKDPQVDNMNKYEKSYEDNGGVHVYSGIPNKAFYLAAVAFGGYSWEKAGQIWWKAMNRGRVPFKCNFKQFANVTISVARDDFDDEAAETVRKAWTEVGVIGTA
ncbi:hypothetical protein PCL_01306 [Purpureocillium lilacinum]|uniref:Metalloprotease n=1 Tax=Purpureocillium lilacinum TaxID=33203 RepID=A0A2U3E333_PURLI|nr:hypothetical protein PCL_01306 [Purpureocillium lilacinum]